MVPFGLANAPKAFQKMVLGFHNSDAQFQSHNQGGSQDEVFFDVVDEFNVHNKCGVVLNSFLFSFSSKVLKNTQKRKKEERKSFIFSTV